MADRSPRGSYWRPLAVGAGAWLVGVLVFVSFVPPESLFYSPRGHTPSGWFAPPRTPLRVLAASVQVYNSPALSNPFLYVLPVATSTAAGYHLARHRRGGPKAGASVVVGMAGAVAVADAASIAVLEGGITAELIALRLLLALLPTSVVSLVSGTLGGGIYRLQRVVGPPTVGPHSRVSGHQEDWPTWSDCLRAAVVGATAWVVGALAFVEFHEDHYGYYDYDLPRTLVHLHQFWCTPDVPISLQETAVPVASLGNCHHVAAWLVASVPAGYYLGKHGWSGSTAGLGVLLGFGSVGATTHLLGIAVADPGSIEVPATFGIVPTLIATTVAGAVGGVIYRLREGAGSTDRRPTESGRVPGGETGQFGPEPEEARAGGPNPRDDRSERDRSPPRGADRNRERTFTSDDDPAFADDDAERSTKTGADDRRPDENSN